MLLWAVLSIVLLLAGLAVIAWFARRLFGDLRHFGSTAANASARLSQAAAELESASQPVPAPGAVPRPRASSARRN